MMVALRKESVDRKTIISLSSFQRAMSLSARRAWIENVLGGWGRGPQGCRSPQGERG